MDQLILQLLTDVASEHEASVNFNQHLIVAADEERVEFLARYRAATILNFLQLLLLI